MNRVLMLLALSAVAVGPPVASAPGPQESATIKVHLINAKNGRPIPGKPVRIWSLEPPAFWPGHFERKTDAEGVATFRLRLPLPLRINIHTGMGGYWDDCSRPDYSVDNILRSGAVQAVDHCLDLPRIQDRFHPKPGEVYFFAVHETLWEHMKANRDSD